MQKLMYSSMINVHAGQVAAIEKELEDARKSINQLLDENKMLQLKNSLLSKLSDNLETRIDLAEENSRLKSYIGIRKRETRSFGHQFHDTMYINKVLHERSISEQNGEGILSLLRRLP